jgi:hypothetical protein
MCLGKTKDRYRFTVLVTAIVSNPEHRIIPNDVPFSIRRSTDGTIQKERARHLK